MTSGTRFRLYPQYAAGYLTPEIVTVTSPPGSIRPGPRDHRMHAVNPTDKTAPYVPFSYMPPYRGACWPPAAPDAAGHFDQIPTDDQQFFAAHLFGCARRTLDIWEGYLGREVLWWHAPALPQLELVARVNWDNAQSGPGFLETGLQPNRYGRIQPFCLNFDIVAHEIGHAILFSEVGVPPPDAISPAFLAFHESFADLVAMIAALHFDSVLARLLAQTDGNLYVLNLVSRIGETSDLDEIRIADNVVTMADVAEVQLGPDGEWIDPTGANRNAHHIAQPLTGAIFDALVDIYQEGLVARGAIPPELDARQWTPREAEAALAWVQSASAGAFAAFSHAFRDALTEARDIVGASLAHVMRSIDPARMDFDIVAARFIEALIACGLGDQLDVFIDDFLFRGIDPRRVWRAPQARHERPWRTLPYAERVRRVAAATRRRACCPGHNEPHAFAFAHAMMRHPHRADPDSAAPAL